MRRVVASQVLGLRRKQNHVRRSTRSHRYKDFMSDASFNELPALSRACPAANGGAGLQILTVVGSQLPPFDDDDTLVQCMPNTFGLG